jgi:hypothetical protein
LLDSILSVSQLKPWKHPRWNLKKQKKPDWKPCMNPPSGLEKDITEPQRNRKLIGKNHTWNPKEPQVLFFFLVFSPGTCLVFAAVWN